MSRPPTISLFDDSGDQSDDFFSGLSSSGFGAPPPSATTSISPAPQTPIAKAVAPPDPSASFFDSISLPAKSASTTGLALKEDKESEKEIISTIPEVDPSDANNLQEERSGEGQDGQDGDGEAKPSPIFSSSKEDDDQSFKVEHIEVMRVEKKEETKVEQKKEEEAKVEKKEVKVEQKKETKVDKKASVVVKEEAIPYFSTDEDDSLSFFRTLSDSQLNVTAKSHERPAQAPFPHVGFSASPSSPSGHHKSASTGFFDTPPSSQPTHTQTHTRAFSASSPFEQHPVRPNPPHTEPVAVALPERGGQAMPSGSPSSSPQPNRFSKQHSIPPPQQNRPPLPSFPMTSPFQRSDALPPSHSNNYSRSGSDTFSGEGFFDALATQPTPVLAHHPSPSTSPMPSPLLRQGLTSSAPSIPHVGAMGNPYARDPQPMVPMIPRASAFEYNPSLSPSVSAAPSVMMQSTTSFHPGRDQAARRPYAVVAFGFGGKIVTIVPRKKKRLNSLGMMDEPDDGERLPGFIKTYALQKVLQNSAYFKELSIFPGPLTSSTSMDSVLRFVDMKRSESQDDEAMLWSLLHIMCKNYGSFSKEHSEALVAVKALLAEGEISQNPLQQAPQKSQQELENAATELQKLLLSGKLEEAIAFAVSHQMWSHALLIASNVSIDRYKQTMLQFANGNVMEGTPMHTMYSMFAGKRQELFHSNSNRVPPVVSNWKGNLACFLSNNAVNAKQLVGSLGDQLWSSQNRVGAAHFCYLIAEHEFGHFDNPNARVVLAGADHKRRAHTFANPQSIQRTEIIEFAKIQANSQFTIHQVQVYKLVYAQFLAEVGLMEAAKKYHQTVSAIVQRTKQSYQYNPFFLRELELFGNRLNVYYGSSNSSSGFSWSIPSLKIGNVFKWMSSSTSKADKTVSPRQDQPAPAPAPTNMAIGIPMHPPVETQPSFAPAPAPSGSPRNVEPVPEPEPVTPPPKKEKGSSTPKSPGIASRISGFLTPIFSRSGTLQADLGVDIGFEYDEALSSWVPKGQKGKGAPTVGGAHGSVGPPPISPPPMGMAPPPSRSSLPPPGSDGPPAMGQQPPGVTLGDSAPPSPSPSPFSNAGRRRVKYVDTLNPDSVPARAAPVRMPEPHNPLSNSFTMFTPAPLPPQEIPPPQQDDAIPQDGSPFPDASSPDRSQQHSDVIQ